MNMQKFSVHTLMCLLACATVACSNELEQKEIPAQGEGEGERITVTAMAGMPKGEPSTRVKFEEDDGAKKLKLSWRPIDDPKGTETFSVFSSKNLTAPSTFTMQSLEGDNATFMGQTIPADDKTYYAIYPALTDATVPATAIPLDMTGQKGDTYDESKTYMYDASSEFTDKTLKFNFKPLTSILVVTLQFPTEASITLPEYDKVVLSTSNPTNRQSSSNSSPTTRSLSNATMTDVIFSAGGLHTKAVADITTGSVTPEGESKSYSNTLTGTFSLSEDTNPSATVVLHLLPGTLTGFQVQAEVNGTIYVGTISASATIEAGTMYKNTVKMEKDPLADAQIGDFYCVKDGNGYLIPKDATLSGDQETECIGIVFGVGSKALEQDSLLRRDHANCSHGLVVALQDATLGDGSDGMYWSVGYESVQDTWVTPSDKYNSTVVNLRADNKLCGYSNTLALMAYNDTKGMNDKLRVLPCDAIQKYSNDKPAPINSSGWYFPSVMELKYVCWGWEGTQSTVGWTELNDQIEKVSGGRVFGTDDYWSSTESSNRGSNAWYVAFRDGLVVSHYKDFNPFRVRPLLAF